MTALRRTKIVATLGPASAKADVLEKMIRAGVDVVRLNFSHGDIEDKIVLATQVERIAAKVGKKVAILADLQGPKIRIARFREGPVTLEVGQRFVLDANLDSEAGDAHQVGIDYKQLAEDVAAGDTLLLDDGRIVLQVESVEASQVICKVVIAGVLSNNKGINRQGGGLSAAALTEKDKRDIELAAQIGADYIAVSFPRSAQDIEKARDLLRAAGGHGGIVAKIERAEAVEVIDEMILASDAVMVARGDLGVEIGDASLPPVQKQIITRARKLNTAVITATQMMESMIDNAIPTRAEVFDVANAVLDGTDAVMLSGETAVGKHPIKVIQAVDRVCLQAEQQRQIRRSSHRIDSHFERVDEAIAMGAMYLANHLDVKAIAAVTVSGSTPLWMSRISSGIPIFGMTASEQSARRMALFRGVYPVDFSVVEQDYAHLNKPAIAVLQQQGIAKEGDIVIVTKGDHDQQGCTNSLKIERVGEVE